MIRLNPFFGLVHLEIPGRDTDGSLYFVGRHVVSLGWCAALIHWEAFKVHPFIRSFMKLNHQMLLSPVVASSTARPNRLLAVLSHLGPNSNPSHNKQKVGVDRMATRQLWLLGILRLQNVANTVEQFDIALLRICFDC